MACLGVIEARKILPELYALVSFLQHWPQESGAPRVDEILVSISITRVCAKAGDLKGVLLAN